MNLLGNKNAKAQRALISIAPGASRGTIKSIILTNPERVEYNTAKLYKSKTISTHHFTFNPFGVGNRLIIIIRWCNQRLCIFKPFGLKNSVARKNL